GGARLRIRPRDGTVRSRSRPCSRLQGLLNPRGRRPLRADAGVDATSINEPRQARDRPERRAHSKKGDHCAQDHRGHAVKREIPLAKVDSLLPNRERPDEDEPQTQWNEKEAEKESIPTALMRGDEEVVHRLGHPLWSWRLRKRRHIPRIVASNRRRISGENYHLAW